MRQLTRRFWEDEAGAIAPTLALILFALIAAGGIAFDYARMAALDTELQNAADQAALAAAGQLDGATGARSRATLAAQNLVANLTVFANDNDVAGTAVTVPTVIFYRNYDPATGAKGPVAANDGEARYVLVTVGTRTAYFALTPVVAAFSSGALQASAFAGMDSAICNVPPVMICNPYEAAGTPFDAAALRGRGLQLVSVGNSGPWAPGNFGYLDPGGLSNGAPGLREALGWETSPGQCSPGTGVDTRTGATVTVTDALNTRFDIYDNQSCPTGGTCRPSTNARKDVVHDDGVTTAGNACRLHSQGWQISDNPYLPGFDTTDPSNPIPIPTPGGTNPDAMGHPRDRCHALATAACGQVGDGAWDRSTYFAVNFGTGFDWQAAMTAAGYTPGSVTRYEVYRWEMADPANRLANRAVGSNVAVSAPFCSATGGLTPGPTTPDRRRFSAALVNCVAQSVNGNSTNVQVSEWVDLFLVEPSLNRDRTHAGDVYVEVIGRTPAGANGATMGQVVRRDVPRLIE
jgi:Flp pilus assembly protein TadG